MDKPSFQKLKFLITASGIHLNEHAMAQLWRFHNSLRQRNQDRDLTRLVGFDSMVQKHYIDCLIIGKFIRIPSPILDIGSGAGFPGIPLKIAYPKLRMILAEPRPNRVAFLNEVIDELALTDIEVFDHKVVSQSFQKPVNAIITRALEPIEKTFLRTSASLGKGGLFIFLKGPAVDPEVTQALNRFAGKIRVVLNHSYRLPGTPFERRLVVLEKLVPAERPPIGSVLLPKSLLDS